MFALSAIAQLMVGDADELLWALQWLARSVIGNDCPKKRVRAVLDGDRPSKSERRERGGEIERERETESKTVQRSEIGF